ncbi:MAG: hypothetical protein V4697_03220 [Patescibacteria group bacterium]
MCELGKKLAAGFSVLICIIFVVTILVHRGCRKQEIFETTRFSYYPILTNVADVEDENLRVYLEGLQASIKTLSSNKTNEDFIFDAYLKSRSVDTLWRGTRASHTELYLASVRPLVLANIDHAISFLVQPMLLESRGEYYRSNSYVRMRNIRTNIAQVSLK